MSSIIIKILLASNFILGTMNIMGYHLEDKPKRISFLIIGILSIITGIILLIKI